MLILGSPISSTSHDVGVRDAACVLCENIPSGKHPGLYRSFPTAIRLRHVSSRTEKAYEGWIRPYLSFHGGAHPRELGANEVSIFLTRLAIDPRNAASTQSQALAALLFLYREVLGIQLPWLEGVVRAKTPQRVPTVLSCAEARVALERIDGPVPRLMATLLYWAGLRLMECCRLRVKDIDFARNQIIVRRGKGDKDRVTMLPLLVKPALTAHLQRVRAQHASDLAGGAGWVELPGALTKKLPLAGRE